MAEQTLMIIKPDGLQRGLVGEILSRFENVGLKLVALKMKRPTRQLLEKHYVGDPEYLTSLGEKSITVFGQFQYNVKEIYGTDDPYEIGNDVREKLITYMLQAPVIATVWEGVGAIELVRKMVGTTTPLTADVGTIRGDYSHVSQLSAPVKGNAMMTIIHASGNQEEAQNEIALWFGQDFKPCEYLRVDEMFF